MTGSCGAWEHLEKFTSKAIESWSFFVTRVLIIDSVSTGFNRYRTIQIFKNFLCRFW